MNLRIFNQSYESLIFWNFPNHWLQEVGTTVSRAKPFSHSPEARDMIKIEQVALICEVLYILLLLISIYKI